MKKQIEKAFNKLNAKSFQKINFEINGNEIKTKLIDNPNVDVIAHGDLFVETIINCSITKTNNKYNIVGEAIEKVISDDINLKPSKFKINESNENLEILIEVMFFEEGYKY